MALNGSSQSQRPFSPPVYPPPPPTLSPGLVKFQQGRSSGEKKVPHRPLTSIAKLSAISFDYQPVDSTNGRDKDY